MIRSSKRMQSLIPVVILLGFALAAPSARACSMVGKIHGKVTDHTTGGALEGMMVSCGLKDGGWGDTRSTDSAGNYKFEDLSPGTYLVSVDMCYGYVQPDPVEVVLPAGADKTVDFDLVRVQDDLAVDVQKTDPDPDPSSGCLGDQVTVKCRIQYQEFSFDPEHFWLWAWDAAAHKSIMIADWDALEISNNTDEENTTETDPDTHTIQQVINVPWNTTWMQNGSFVLKAAMTSSNTLDPANGKHAGDPPPDESTDGTAGGATLSVDVKNIVITSYSAAPSGHPLDFFKYDPNGSGAFAAPTVTVNVDNYKDEPMEIVVWMCPTAWGDTRPNTWTDPYMNLAITSRGSYTLTWDGSNPGWWGPGESDWGTYSFDIDLDKPDAATIADTFQAKTDDGWSSVYEDIMYDTTFGTHSVQWTQNSPTDPLVLRCTYVVESHSDTPPAWVALVPVDPVLGEQSAVSGDTALDVVHDAVPPTGDGSGPGIAAYSTSNPDDTLGTWRVVLIGETNSGKELRRDRTNPEMLATNQTVTTVKVEKIPLGGSANLSKYVIGKVYVPTRWGGTLKLSGSNVELFYTDGSDLDSGTALNIFKGELDTKRVAQGSPCSYIVPIRKYKWYYVKITATSATAVSSLLEQKPDLGAPDAGSAGNPAQVEKDPWSCHWYPFAEDVAPPHLYDDGECLDLYDKAYGQDGNGAQELEKATHYIATSTPGVNDWFGHCDPKSCAVTWEEEPKNAYTVPGTTQNFTTTLKKGLMVALYDGFSYEYWVGPDPKPHEWHRRLEEELIGNDRMACVDVYNSDYNHTKDTVWNYPLYKYEAHYKEKTGQADEKAVEVRVTIFYWTSSGAASLRYKYYVTYDASGEASSSTAGDWDSDPLPSQGANYRRPDYIWHGKKQTSISSHWGTKLNYTNVRSILNGNE